MLFRLNVFIIALENVIILAVKGLTVAQSEQTGDVDKQHPSDRFASISAFVSGIVDLTQKLEISLVPRKSKMKCTFLTYCLASLYQIRTHFGPRFHLYIIL